MSEMINLAHADMKVGTNLCNVCIRVVENNRGARIVLMQIKRIRACVSYFMTHTIPFGLEMRLNKTKCIEFIIGLNVIESLSSC